MSCSPSILHFAHATSLSTFRVVELEGDLDYSSKLDRSSSMIERLLLMGQERAAWFFDGRSLWPR
ncbi:hypothetical protein [Rhizobium gallicum]|uniref:hypothetical protein n=1 Tax=Rhizobium gallicum TaxID=56730 RepID=UPI001EF98B8B|nr:hypothetical protein [Rhizobium gallicum]ULJ74422.1 hypothetical protein L2W42_21360 [Rhizobium gallicum]